MLGSGPSLIQVRDIWLPASDTHFKGSIEKTGSYLIERLHAAMTYCPAHCLAVDVGAHVGLWTRDLLDRFKKVYAFEPDSDNFRCLLLNTATHLNRSLHARNVAVGREAGIGTTLADPLPKRQGNSGARYVQVTDRSEPGVPVVPIVTLDSYNLSTCDFLKIDVEGAELNVLVGARETIERCHPVIMLEVGKTPPERFGYAVDAPLEYLRKLGMRVELEMRADKVLVWPAT